MGFDPPIQKINNPTITTIRPILPTRPVGLPPTLINNTSLPQPLNIPRVNEATSPVQKPTIFEYCDKLTYDKFIERNAIEPTIPKRKYDYPSEKSSVDFKSVFNFIENYDSEDSTESKCSFKCEVPIDKDVPCEETSGSLVTEPRCIICKRDDLDLYVLSCGHLFCSECKGNVIDKLKDKVCPECHTHFNAVIRVNFI